MKVFARARPVIGMVHLLPLPGSPRARSLDEMLDRAVRDARALALGGVDGVIVENFGDAPFEPGSAPPQVVAAMSIASREVRLAAKVPVGVNVLRNDPRSALAVALASGASFIRVNVHVGAVETDQGRIDGRAHETLRYRRAIDSEAAIFADVLVKHARHSTAADPAVAAREIAYRGLADALLVTGPETGSAADPERLRAVKRAVPDRPVLIASGVTLETAGGYGEADGFIVGSAFKREGRVDQPVEARRVGLLVRALRGARALKSLK
jgi:uncharacterized protein